MIATGWPQPPLLQRVFAFAEGAEHSVGDGPQTAALLKPLSHAVVNLAHCHSRALGAVMYVDRQHRCSQSDAARERSKPTEGGRKSCNHISTSRQHLAWNCHERGLY